MELIVICTRAFFPKREPVAPSPEPSGLPRSGQTSQPRFCGWVSAWIPPAEDWMFLQRL